MNRNWYPLVVLALLVLLVWSVVLYSTQMSEIQNEMKTVKSEISDLKKRLIRSNVEPVEYFPIERSTAEQTTPKKDYVIEWFQTMKVTAYCPCSRCCGNYSDGVTSTGSDAFTKGVAVDPNRIPYGTLIDIPDYGLVKADDCGGAIKGNRLDVRFPTHQEALNWGVKYLKVKIIYKD